MLFIIVIIIRMRMVITLSASSGPPYSQGGTGKYGFESDLVVGNGNGNNNGGYVDLE